MSGVHVTIKGDEDLSRKLHSVAFNLTTFYDAFDEIGEAFRDQFQDQFNASAGWAPLRPRTIALRGGTSKPLVRFGSLMRSWVSLGPQNINQIGAKTAKYGSRYRGISNTGKIVPLAAMHQSGTSRMPARPVIMGSLRMDYEIVDAFADQIFSGWI